MQELLGRLRVIDSSAADALSVIRYFDSLVEGRAGVQAFLRAAAALSGAVVGIDVPALRISVRVSPEGRSVESPDPDGSANWNTQSLAEGLGGRVWIERHDDPAPSDAMILERLSTGVQIALARTRHQQSHDPARVDVLLDSDSSLPDRREAAQRLGLDMLAPAWVVAVLPACGDDGPADVPTWPRSTRIGRVTAVVLQPKHDASEIDPEFRWGTGSAHPVDELYLSWREAVTALRFTANLAFGPPRHLCFDDLGVFRRLADSWDRDPTPDPDVSVLQEMEEEAPGSIVVLEALASTYSYRQAAALLYRHHSSLQARIPRIEEALGFKLDAPGRSRLAAALAVRRLQASGSLP